MRNLTRAVWILGAALLAGSVGAGCGGDDDDDSSGDFSTGIAPSTLLSDVTEEQAASACQKLSTRFDSKLPEEKLTRSFCTLFAAASTENKADCETARDSCIDDAADGGGVGAGAAGELGDVKPDCTGEANLDQCQGTVGDLETCVNDTLDTILGFLDSFSCDDAGNVDTSELEGMGDELTQPASCEAVDCGEGGPFSGGDSN